MPYRPTPPAADAMCGTCNLTEIECECHECEECSTRMPCESFCHTCERCAESTGRACCACVQRRRASYVTVAARPMRGTGHGSPSRRYPRYLGVEIECGSNENDPDEYRYMADSCGRWNASIHGDGSISNSLGHTIEISTSPARGEAFIDQVKDITKGLKRWKAKVDTSCGLHVHVGVPGWTIREVLNLVALYHKLEPALYEIVPPSRATGTYAKPWGKVFERSGALDRSKTLREREEALDIHTYGSLEEAGQAKRDRYKHGSRYHGLNLNSIPVHGTIEFRLHSGTVNPKKILMWAAVCTAIVEYAAGHTEEQINALTGEPMSILKRVCPEASVQEWIHGRRLFFVNRERARRGEPLLTGPEAGPVEASEAR